MWSSEYRGAAPGRPDRLGGVQCLRAAAALMVAAAHLMGNEQLELPSPVLPGWLQSGVTGVDLFFVISGFVMVLVTRRIPRGPRMTALFLYNRVTRIYPPVWLFLGLAVLSLAVFGSSVWWRDPALLTRTFLLLPQGAPRLLGGVTWTLVHEMYFYLVFAVMLLGPARLVPLWLGLWSGLIAAAHLAGWAGASVWTALIFHPLTLEFVAGCCIGLLVAGGRRRFGPAALALGAGGYAALWLFTGADLTASPWLRTAGFGTCAALAVYGVAVLEADHGWRPPAAGRRLGDWSYALYLSHPLVLLVSARLWAPVSDPGAAWDNYLWAALALCACVTVAALSYRFFERPALRLAAAGRRRLFGAAPLPPREGLADRVW